MPAVTFAAWSIDGNLHFDVIVISALDSSIICEI